MKITETSVQVVALIFGFLLLYFLFGLVLALIFVLIWLNKVILGRVVIVADDIGLEMITSSLILVGIFYGPIFAFLFGFLILPIILGFLDLISWFFAVVVEEGWPLFIPSPDSFIYGLIGALAGILIGYGFEFPLIIVFCLIFRGFLNFLKGKLMDSPTDFLTVSINLGFNAAVLLAIPYFYSVFVLQFFSYFS